MPFYEACVHDSCSCDSGGDCECFCSAVASYAQECTKEGACVFWRTPDLCRECPLGEGTAPIAWVPAGSKIQASSSSSTQLTHISGLARPGSDLAGLHYPH